MWEISPSDLTWFFNTKSLESVVFVLLTKSLFKSLGWIRFALTGLAVKDNTNRAEIDIRIIKVRTYQQKYHINIYIYFKRPYVKNLDFLVNYLINSKLQVGTSDEIDDGIL